MNRNFIALILAAGLGALSYRYIGRRQGYSNLKQVWLIVGSVFIIGYLILISTFIWLVHF